MRLAAGEGRLILIVAIGCGAHDTFAQQPLDVAGRAASNLAKGPWFRWRVGGLGLTRHDAEEMIG